MTTATETKLYTAADLLAMPDDGVERWLIRGQLREKQPEVPGATMTVRNRHHCEATVCIGTAIRNWIRSQPGPRGKVYGGEAGVLLQGGEGTTVGVDVVYLDAATVAAQTDDETSMISGVPTLVVEILSPNDTQAQIEEKTDEYLAAGVPLVWIVNPWRRTVIVHRPGQPTLLFNDGEQMAEFPPMPGFAPPVAELFE